MSQPRNKPAASEPGVPLGSKYVADGPSPRRVFLFGSIVIVVFVAVVLGATRVFLFPLWEANSEGVRQVATAQAQISVASTREALTPVPTATAPAAASAKPTTEATPEPTKVPVALAQATAAPTPVPAGVPTTVPIASAAPVLLPTPTADQAAEIAAAYKQYFDVSGEALMSLDATGLDDVAAGDSLAGLQQNIERDRTEGRALQTSVEHLQVYVVDVQGDEADVADRYKDSSIYVDPTTHAPLPGQVTPASPDVAPIVSVVYHLQRIEGVWKVVSGQRFIPQGTQ